MFWNDGEVSDIINQENDKMRVIAGKARRIPLVTVKGMETRPTTDRTKETLFNMIAHGLCNCTFLDLFSGSGAIGIEAISRGVKKAVFVENNPNAIQNVNNAVVPWLPGSSTTSSRPMQEMDWPRAAVPA